MSLKGPPPAVRGDAGRKIALGYFEDCGARGGEMSVEDKFKVNLNQNLWGVVVAFGAIAHTRAHAHTHIGVRPCILQTQGRVLSFALIIAVQDLREQRFTSSTP